MVEFHHLLPEMIHVIRKIGDHRSSLVEFHHGRFPVKDLKVSGVAPESLVDMEV
jgi:hypothetical protein